MERQEAEGAAEERWLWGPGVGDLQEKKDEEQQGHLRHGQGVLPGGGRGNTTLEDLISAQRSKVRG